MKNFISLLGVGGSGKSTTLNNLRESCNGAKLKYKRKDGTAICKIDDNVVFIQTWSPQEAGHGNMEEVLDLLKESIDYIEKIASICGITKFVIVMAFNSKPRNPELLLASRKYVEERGYSYAQIPKEKNKRKDDILQDVKEILKGKEVVSVVAGMTSVEVV
ncbi:MAG TPA: hypothetical protein VL945_00735 [Candidatus Saccharimonadales bacterium]|nr:hypothetical protein [Candidatus Saccharimonadales bacterium]